MFDVLLTTPCKCFFSNYRRRGQGHKRNFRKELLFVRETVQFVRHFSEVCRLPMTLQTTLSIRGPAVDQAFLESGGNWSLESGARVAVLAIQLDLVKTHEGFFPRKLDFQYMLV